MPNLVDRVSSAARALPPMDGAHLTITRSAGPYLFGDDGRRYVDTPPPPWRATSGRSKG